MTVLIQKLPSQRLFHSFIYIFRETACSLKPSQVAPVGEAFRLYKEKYGEEKFLRLSQKADDDHHSSLRGSFLSALVHYNMIFEEKSLGNTFRLQDYEHKGKMFNLSETETERLQRIADKVSGTASLRKQYIFEENDNQCMISPCIRGG